MLSIALGTRNRIYLRTNAGTMAPFRASWLEDAVPGFKQGRKSVLKAVYPGGRVTYHEYEGGTIWTGIMPEHLGDPGDTIELSISLLTKIDFLSNMPAITMENEAQFSWLPILSRVTRIRGGSETIMQVEQNPPLEGISKFDLCLQNSTSVEFVPGYGCFLEGEIRDFCGMLRRLRIYHDGHSVPWMGLKRGRRFPKISFMSFDGFRLRLAYGSPEIRVATVYLASPVPLYSVTAIRDERGIQGGTEAGWRMQNSYLVELTRETEREMLRSRYRYPHGRIGSEIAYSIASRQMGFQELVLNDPSAGGADMMTRDGKTVFESRLLVITSAMTSSMRTRQVDFQLQRMRKRLRSDLSFYKEAEVGYALLSYVDSGNLKTVQFEMRR